jgi:hypothetical protein
VDYSFLAGASFPEPVPASSSAALERWYRRLVACYPRSFRRQSTEEIIAVLLATARADQRRPSLAEAADLLRGALRMRTAMPGSPRTVRNAVRLMCLGSVVQLTVLIVTLAGVGSIRAAARSAALHQGPAQVANALALVNFHLAVDVLIMPGLSAGWLLVAWANARGYEWARPAALIAFLFYTGNIILSLAQGSATSVPAAIIVSGAVWVIGLAAIVLLVMKQSWPYYARQAVAAR